MGSNIRKMYCFDCAILLVLAALLVFIVSYVLYSLGYVPNELPVRISITASGLFALLFALTGMITVMFHLHQNIEDLYGDEMEIDGIRMQIEVVDGETI